LLQNRRTGSQNGYSFLTWAAVFSIVLAAALFIRTPLKRALWGKIIATTDYMLWGMWGGTPDQYKGEDTSFIKTQTSQSVLTRQKETRGYIRQDLDSLVTENTVSSGVEDGSQSVLRTFDLNAILPTEANPPAVVEPPVVVPPAGGLPDVPANGSAQEALHTCFYGQMNRTPMPEVGEVRGIASYCTNVPCRQSCRGGGGQEEQGCLEGCVSYCGQLCAILPEEYQTPCGIGCGA